MTEQEWLEAPDPQPMLDFLRGKASERKLRLFAVASSRRLIALLPDARQRRGIEVLEQLAEGTIPLTACRGVAAEVRHSIPADNWVSGLPPSDDPHHVALMFYREFCSSRIAVHAVQAAAGLANGATEQHEQVHLMRCVFVNPFRSITLDFAWPTWHNGLLVSMARQMYDSRDFRDMPVLADALEEAGCNNADILDHCRSAGEHVRGCWVIDALLGKS